MKVVWIVLIAFSFAFLVQGRSLPSRNPKEANDSPVFPSESNRLRPEGTTDDFTGPGLYANDKQSFNPPSEHHVRTASNNEWGYGAPQDEEPDLEIDKLSPSDTDWSSGAPEDEEPELETDEQAPSDTELELWCT
ncbi:hypothetical protein ACROYT_G033478 [Oculina patagonica]